MLQKHHYPFTAITLQTSINSKIKCIKIKILTQSKKVGIQFAELHPNDWKKKWLLQSYIYNLRIHNFFLKWKRKQTQLDKNIHTH